MPKLLPAHRRQPHQNSKREFAPAKKKDLLAVDDNNDYDDDSPRELLAMGAVLDHLCRGGQLSDSLRVFMKEAGRGRRGQEQRMRSKSRNHSVSRLSCLHSCSSSHVDCLTLNSEYRDDSDVDDGFTIPTAALRRLQKDSKVDDQDLTLSLEDLTIDEVTLESFDEENPIGMVDFDAVMLASNEIWNDLDSNKNLRFVPAFLGQNIDDDGAAVHASEEKWNELNLRENMRFVPALSEQYVDEGGAGVEVESTRAMCKQSQTKEHLQIVPSLLEHYIDEDDVDEEILEAIARNVAEVEEDLYDLVTDPHGHDIVSTALSFGLSFDQDEDDESVNSLAKKMHGMLQRKSSRLFATSDTKGDRHKNEMVRRSIPSLENCSTSHNMNYVSVLANAPNLPWPPSFPSSHSHQCETKSSDSPLSFKSKVNLASAIRTLSSRTGTNHTVVRGNGNSRNNGNSNDPLVASTIAPVKLDNQADSCTASSPSRSSGPQSTLGILSNQLPVSPCRGGLLKRIIQSSRKPCRKEEGILAPLVRNERVGRGEFEVQHVEQNRMEI
jgi:hypothetical protein